MKIVYLLALSAISSNFMFAGDNIKKKPNLTLTIMNPNGFDSKPVTPALLFSSNTHSENVFNAAFYAALTAKCPCGKEK